MNDDKIIGNPNNMTANLSDDNSENTKDTQKPVEDISIIGTENVDIPPFPQVVSQDEGKEQASEFQAPVVDEINKVNPPDVQVMGKPDEVQPAFPSVTQSTIDSPTKVKEENIIKPPKGKKRGVFVATILGLILLVGGVSAGVILVQREQEVRERAYVTPSDRKMVCSIDDFQFYVSEGQTSESENSQCPPINQCGTDNQTGTNEISTYTTNHNILIEPITQNPGDPIPEDIGEIKIKYYKNSNYCSDYACGHTENFTGTGGAVCHLSPEKSAAQEVLLTTYNSPASLGQISRTSDSGQACGSFQTDIMITEVVGATCQHSRGVLGEEDWVLSAGVCQTGISCAANKLYCRDVSIYKVTGDKTLVSNWTKISVNDLTKLESGDKVYLTVRAESFTNTDNGGFDKARFTVNNVLRPEVTAIKPDTDSGDNIFELYDEYTIPANTDSFSISVEIHHTDSGWF